MDALLRLLREPNLILAAVTAGIAMAVGLDWIELTTDQQALVLAFIAAMLIIVRQLVTPVSDPRLANGTPVNGGASRVVMSDGRPG